MSAPPTAPALSLESNDYDAGCELILLNSVINTLQRFSALMPNQHRQVLGPVITMVARLREIRGSHGDVSEGKLKEALQKLDTEGGVLPIHIRCQLAEIPFSGHFPMYSNPPEMWRRIAAFLGKSL